MSDSKSSSPTSWFLGGLVFWAFILIKGWGTALAAWSWWWVLLPVVPVMWVVLEKAGLL